MENTTLIGRYAPDFELRGIDDSVHHLARYLEDLKLVGVVFMCNHCPYVGMYLERLKTIQATFQAQGFTLVGINSNDATQFPEDSFDQMKIFAAERQLNFPYLRDDTQDVARSFHAEKTPQVFLINHQSVICYGGGIDDDPQNGSTIPHRYLEDAILEILRGKAVSVTSGPAVGCSIKWRT
ncbi:thioredoxin family protein [Leptolyngbya sp. 'hensonii']|uniref:thioredoxin family protein n=1 Tax=Leptolyngbya sp. 'hensonii' TaxID=1922337 RepID=UPI00094F54D4|nr:thioredoxin family protein [Leptolyngbya sp. 'hensonii']OLP17724.1 thioredoxin family protein [Leptolyngbya sp. 'hensonii']